MAMVHRSTVVLLLGLFIPLGVNASTFHLSYDAIVSPLTVLERATDTLNLQGETENVIVPPSIARGTTKKIGADLITKWVNFKDALGETTNFSDVELPVGLNCFPQQTYDGRNPGTFCAMDHSSPGLSFQISTTVYQAEGAMSDYSPNDGGVLTLGEDQVPVAVRMDIIINANTASDIGMTYARDALVEITLAMAKATHTDFVPAPLWKIEERLSPLQVFNAIGSPSPQALRSASSLESMVLSNPATLYRTPVISSSKKIYKKRKNSAEDTGTAEMEQDIHLDLDIWHHQEIGTKHPVFSLFLYSTLRIMTNSAGNAHAEAFVHPALVSHKTSERILVISEMPLSYVREIMKYEDVYHVSVVGADMLALEMAKIHIPQLDDCSFIQDRSDSCMDDSSIELVDTDIHSWLDSMIAEIDEENSSVCEMWDGYQYCSEHPQFDVILLDTSENKSVWFELEFHRKLQLLMTDESILVVNSGSTPSIDEDSMNSSSSSWLRDKFLISTTKRQEKGGLGYQVAHVYDEPLAGPLEDAYIALFKYESTAYYSFIQKDATAKDIALVGRMRQQPNLPTQNYDGITHIRYATPSRAWENWFCGISPGRELPGCSTFLVNWYDGTKHSYFTEVKTHPIKGRSLFTTSEIAEGDFILPDDSYLSLRLDDFQWDYLNEFVNDFPDAHLFKDLRDFFQIYGFETYSIGSSGWRVSFSNNTFTNHACTEADATVNYITSAYIDGDGDPLRFSPLLSRRSDTMNQVVSATRDLKKNEEIMVDYHSFRENTPDFKAFLDTICSTGIGLVPVEHKDYDGGLLLDEL